MINLDKPTTPTNALPLMPQAWNAGAGFLPELPALGRSSWTVQRIKADGMPGGTYYAHAACIDVDALALDEVAERTGMELEDVLARRAAILLNKGRQHTTPQNPHGAEAQCQVCGLALFYVGTDLDGGVELDDVRISTGAHQDQPGIVYEDTTCDGLELDANGEDPRGDIACDRCYARNAYARGTDGASQ